MVKKIKFRLKQKAGTHYRYGATYGPGDIIELTRAEASGIMHKLDYVDSEDAKTTEVDETPEVEVIIMEREDGYDVVNTSTSCALNKERLTKEAARALAGPDAGIILLNPRDENLCDDEPTDQDEEGNPLAKHVGGGWWTVINAKTGEVLLPKRVRKEAALDYVAEHGG